MALIDAPRDVVFVHGVQWQRDYELKGYSRATQDLMQNQAPTIRFRFHEVLWSDVVEVDERKLLGGVGVIDDLLTGDLAGSAFDLFKLIGQRTDFKLKSRAEAFKTPLPKLIAVKGGFIGNALSAILDIVFYFSPTYGPRVRAKVRETLVPYGAACHRFFSAIVWVPSSSWISSARIFRMPPLEGLSLRAAPSGSSRPIWTVLTSPLSTG